MNDELSPAKVIRVEYKSEVLGDGVFWEGPVTAVAEIHNIPARETAQMVAKDGNARVYGMWHVSMLTAALGHDL